MVCIPWLETFAQIVGGLLAGVGLAAIIVIVASWFATKPKDTPHE